MLSIRQVLVAIGILFAAQAQAQVRAIETVLDFGSARAVLAALRNPDLSRQDALGVAGLPGNQGLVRKLNSYHIQATTESFADALFAAAHGTPSNTPTAKGLGFESLKPRVAALESLIARIEADPAGFQGWVMERVKQYSPVDNGVAIEGFLVVGGSSGGFAFAEPRFYLNLAYFDEFDPAKVVLSHELYHAVQAAYGVDGHDRWLKPESATAGGKQRRQVCANLADLFTNLYQEGSASFVGDPLLLDPSSGPLAMRVRSEFEEGLSRLKGHSTLLELAVVGLQAKAAVPYDDIYALGFYVPEPLYKLGYQMAKAIALDEGQQALAAFLSKPGYEFAAHYTRLPLYGKDRVHPSLGPNTVKAIHALASGCGNRGK